MSTTYQILPAKNVLYAKKVYKKYIVNKLNLIKFNYPLLSSPIK